jgi:hypothetical protein
VIKGDVDVVDEQMEEFFNQNSGEIPWISLISPTKMRFHQKSWDFTMGKKPV